MTTPPALVPVTVYLPAEVAELYRKQAAGEDRTLSAECRRTLIRSTAGSTALGELVDLYIGGSDLLAAAEGLGARRLQPAPSSRRLHCRKYGCVGGCGDPDHEAKLR